MPVSVRTRLPVCSACWNSAERTGPLTPSSFAYSKARRTWPTTSLAHDRRLEPRGDRKQVRGHVVVEPHGGARRQIVGGHARVFGEDLVDLRHRAVETVHHGVHLGAQAGGQHHRLLQGSAGGAARRARGADRRRSPPPRRAVEGGLLVLEPYDDDGHALPFSVGSQACRSLIAPCQSPAPLGTEAGLVQPMSGEAESPTERMRGTCPLSAAAPRSGPSWRAR